MKFLIIFFSALAAASTFDLLNAEVQQRDGVVPVVETEEGLIYNDTIPADVREGRVINGIFAAIDQFPHQVGVINHNNKGQAFCGGSLIGRNWVLSAAHCMAGVQNVTVCLGSTAWAVGNPSYNVNKDQVIIHPAYGKSMWHDICLIKIPTVTYNYRVQPIRLPSMSKNNSYADYSGIAVGWGLYYPNSGISYFLRWGRTKIISNDDCRKNFGKIGRWVITKNNICMSSDNGINSCFGDSGGPLIAEDSNTLVGITSFGAHRSCVKYYISAFTRVSEYLDWIKYHTGIYYP